MDPNSEPDPQAPLATGAALFVLAICGSGLLLLVLVAFVLWSSHVNFIMVTSVHPTATALGLIAVKLLSLPHSFSHNSSISKHHNRAL